MKVCIDIQPAVAQRAGVGRYTKCLVEHLGPFVGDDEVSLFYFDFKRNGSPFTAAGTQEKAVQWVPGRVVQKAWKTLGWPSFDSFAGPADVFHFTNFIRPPLRKGRSVVNIHDLSFIRHPDTMEARNYEYLSRHIKQTVEKADALLAISHFGGNEIHQLLDVPKDRIFSIPLAISPELSEPAPGQVAAVKKRLGLEKPYLLFVSTIEPRKNVGFLVDLLEEMNDFDGELVLAGAKGWRYEPIFERIKTSPQAHRIRHLDFVSDKDLPALYAGAACFVFPSLYEGFGFTPLEAMALGTPVVSSSGGSLKEVLGDAAEVLDAYDPEQWAHVVQKVLDDSDHRDALIKRGREQVQSYSWEKTAEETFKVYRKVAG